ncbi:SAM-dependent methyltransferase [Desulfobaculum xiamenense]|uniref:SAM-dependent methyltransferase n=1 Tax=Desulfobaculum xiamenense TaxID=995050 RepID=A0A846QGN9_9BACT|nr:class I SAM-dependent methyltransferase [Desulfobaculum xiamenense]NJB67966.1 SAM-dependent methyltransferase [Desulfobaculum xiamenense]
MSTRWDGESVARYEEWFETREGAFAFTQERRLLERLVSAWPRRGQRLLDIGCGPGMFLKALWETGFDVSGLDSSPDMLGAARRRLGPHASYHIGQADHLPFDENEFEFAVLMTVLEFCDDPEAVLREAARVARHGLIIGFLNRWSLYWWAVGRAGAKSPEAGRLAAAHWFSPLDIRRMVGRAIGLRVEEGASVLPGPVWTWRGDRPWGLCNRLVYPFELGAYCAVRIDLSGGKPLTPLMAFSARPCGTG